MDREELRILQKKEANDRIDELTEAFHLNPHIKEYFNEGKVYYSYITGGVIGSIDTIEYDKRYAEVVRDFEQRTDSLVYHAIETGNMLALLYVSPYPDGWSMGRLCENYISSYVHNFEAPELSEFGDIFLDGYMNSGCLIRIG